MSENYSSLSGSEAAAPAPHTSHNLAQGKLAKPKFILFLDANPDVAAAYAKQYGERGYQTLAVQVGLQPHITLREDCTIVGHLQHKPVQYYIRNARDLKRLLDGLDVKPDAVIADLDMPGFGGAEVTQFIKQHYPKIPTIIHATQFAQIGEVNHTYGPFPAFSKFESMDVVGDFLDRQFAQMDRARK